MEDTENNYQKYKFTETLTQQFSSGNFQQTHIHIHLKLSVHKFLISTTEKQCK